MHDFNLLITDKRGRDKHLFINVIPIKMIHSRWTTEYSALWAGRMLDIKFQAEQKETGKKQAESEPKRKQK